MNNPYKNQIRLRSKGIFGESEEMIGDSEPIFTASGILREWLKDDDIQEITVCSSNIGFVKTFRKFYKETPIKPPIGKRPTEEELKKMGGGGA